jgi:hypothetical protein
MTQLLSTTNVGCPVRIPVVAGRCPCGGPGSRWAPPTSYELPVRSYISGSRSRTCSRIVVIEERSFEKTGFAKLLFVLT